MPIDEISFPLPTIFDITKKDQQGIKIGFLKESSTVESYKHEFIDIDINDGLVEDLANECEISVEFARELIILFFDEIRTNLLLGNVIILRTLGNFFLGDSVKTDKKPTPRNIMPKFQATRFFKAETAKRNTY